MSEDIAERLRESANNPVPYFQSEAMFRILCEQGAAEIERLRATIEQLRSVTGAVSLDAPTFGQINKDAHMSKVEELAKLRHDLRIDPSEPLLLPDCGDKVMVVVRYKGAELGFVVSQDHMDRDECLSAPLLMVRNALKELAELSNV